MTDFRLKPIVVLVLALLVPILLAGCGDSEEDARPELSRSELQEIVQGELVKAPSVDPGLILEDVEEAIQAATGRTTGQEPGPTYGEVEAMVEAALTGLWEQGPGLTRGDAEVVRAVIAEMSEPEPGLDRAEVQRIARTCPLCRKRRRPQHPLKGLAVGRQRLRVNLASLVVTLREEAQRPVRTIQWYPRTLHQLKLSVGAIVRAVHQVAQQAGPEVGESLERIRASPVVHAGETGWREKRLRLDFQHSHGAVLPAPGLVRGGGGRGPGRVL